MDTTQTPPRTSHLLSIPAEIREHIYRLILHPAANRLYHSDEYTSYSFSAALVLFRLNRQIYLESRKIFRELNTFVRIETPWPEAQLHVASEGHVPTITQGKKAARFTGHSLSVRIDAPEVPIEIGEDQMFLILVDDLEGFARMWFYSNLSHPGLNPQLRLTLILRDPFTPEYEEKRAQKSLQQRLLLPFGQVRDLRSVVLQGDPRPLASIEKELRAKQAEPETPPEACLAECIRFKDLGNAALKRKDYASTLAYYTKAWESIHIVVAGHQRHIHGDRFFSRPLHLPPYDNHPPGQPKNGQTERLVLRVTLVANTCEVHLQMKNYAECVFWGMRTISMIREAMGWDAGRAGGRVMELAPEEEAVTGFPAAVGMGKIYYRTGVAYREMGQKAEARRLLRVAERYLPAGRSVGEALASVALRLG